MKKTMLHELLAVEGDLESKRKQVIEETKTVFSKKPEMFVEQHRKLEMFVDDNIKYPQTFKKMDTTVRKKLWEMQITEKRYYDAILQKELTNQEAVADLIVDGVAIASNLPATFLLGMETRLKHLRTLYEAIPTLPHGASWVKDENFGDDVYRNEHPEEKIKTETIVEPIVLYEATKEHPAQIKETSKVNNVGKYVTNTWLGMISSSEKNVKLGRIDKLIQAFKKARQRANTTEVVKKKIGKELFDYIESV